jgi:YD repeat-containing protein
MSRRLRRVILTSVAVIAWMLVSVITYAGSLTYTYDSLNRLSTATYEDGRVIQYGYDAAGNRTVLYDSATPPITTANPSGGLFGSAPCVELTCTDLSGYGCDDTYYCTGAECSPDILYSSCINISATTTLRFYSTDLAPQPNTETPVKTQVYTVDTTAPTGTIDINSGAASTNSVNVTLTLTCSDASGCSQMKFSNDVDNEPNYSTPEAYSATKAWALSSGDATKTVYAKFKDTAGNWSSAYNDSIQLDTTPPTGTISINSGASCTNTSTATLTLSCSDTGGSGCSKMKFSNDGSSYSDEEDYNTSKQWPLDSTSNGTKTVYVRFRDAAWNWSDPPSSDDITLSLPVRILRTPLVPYTSIQTAYNAAQTGDTIQCQVFPFDEDLTVNRDISVTLEGGYDCGYTTNSGATTSIKGKIQTTPGGGTLTMGNIGNFVLATK